MRKLTMNCSNLTPIVLLAVALSEATLLADADADCHAIASRYEAVHQSTTRGLPHYSWLSEATQNDGQWEQADVWKDDQGPAKIRVARGNSSFKQELELYLAGGEVFFTLLRHEVFPELAADGKTKLEEERRYFKDGRCIRILKRKGVFSPKEKPDLSKVKNQSVNPDTEPNDFADLSRIAKTLLARLPLDLSLQEVLDGKRKP
jgi:hypothetical protein